jgi:hypothetical protein
MDPGPLQFCGGVQQELCHRADLPHGGRKDAGKLVDLGLGTVERKARIGGEEDRLHGPASGPAVALAPPTMIPVIPVFPE